MFHAVLHYYIITLLHTAALKPNLSQVLYYIFRRNLQSKLDLEGAKRGGARGGSRGG